MSLGNVVVIDDGSGAIKANGKAFSSFVVEGHKDGACSFFRIGFEDFAVVDTHHGALDTTRIEYQTSNSNLVMVHHALMQSGVTGDIKLAVTLPASIFYQKNGAKNLAEIKKKQTHYLKSIDALDQDFSSVELPYRISEVIVFPESAPAIYDAGTAQVDVMGTTIILDIGKFTADVSVFDGGKFVSAASSEDGTHQLFGLIQRELSNVGSPLSTRSRDDLQVRYRRGQLSASIMEPAIANWVSRLVATDEFSRELAIADLIVVCGGGAYIAGEHIKNLLDSHNVFIPFEPEYAISRGIKVILESQA
ncbi:MAG: ParM/StbA family protein [Ferrimonas sp.]